VPSPVAHSLAGLAIARVAHSHQWISGRWLGIGLVLLAANAADLDFLPGLLLHGRPDWFHHGPTHSLLAAALVALASGAIALAAGASAIRVGAIFGIAYLSHIALDFMTVAVTDTSDMPLLWPFSYRLFSPPLEIFLPIRHISRRTTFFGGLFSWANVVAIGREFLVMGGLWVVWLGARALRSRTASRSSRRT
jgi:inner membrane protein